jgi:hypothetical protein
VAEHDRPPVGSVAEEASRLLDALGGWAGSASAAYAGSAPRDREAPDATGAEAPGAGAPGAQTTGAESVDEPGLHGAGRCETCGAENGAGQAVTCQLCPVCQGIALLRSVRPETVDRLADLAGAVAATLRDLADQRRTASAGPASPASGHTSGRPGHRVHDIVVDDEEPEVAP